MAQATMAFPFTVPAVGQRHDGVPDAVVQRGCAWPNEYLYALNRSIPSLASGLDSGVIEDASNLVQSAPNGVMPASLCTAFTELRSTRSSRTSITTDDPAVAACADLAPDVQAQQTVDRIRALGAVQLLVSQNGGLMPFAFYNPFDVASGQQIGSNYDPTGNSTQGA